MCELPLHPLDSLVQLRSSVGLIFSFLLCDFKFIFENKDLFPEIVALPNDIFLIDGLDLYFLVVFLSEEVLSFLMNLQFLGIFGYIFVLFLDGLVGHDEFHFQLLVLLLQGGEFVFVAVELMLKLIVGEIQSFELVGGLAVGLL